MSNFNLLQQAVSQHFSRAAKQYDTAAQLQLAVIKKAFSLLNLTANPLSNPHKNKIKTKRVNNNIPHILDIGCGTANLVNLLTPPFHYTGVDIAAGMLVFAAQKYPNLPDDCQLNFKQANAELLPFSDNTFPYIFSSLAVQWCDLSQVLKEVYRVLKPGGEFVFTTLIDGTLTELNQAYLQLDNQSPVNHFMTATELQDHLQQQEWSSKGYQIATEPTIYASVYDLLKELKAIGANTVMRSPNQINRPSLNKSRLALLEVYYPSKKIDMSEKTTIAIKASWQVAYCRVVKPR